MTNVTLPSPRNEKLNPRTAPHTYIPPDRIAQIFERFPEGSSPHIAMMLSYKAGLRLGDALGVTWDDVDFTENTISINRQVQWDETKKFWYLSKSKYYSFRTIDLDDECMELLKQEIERQMKAKNYYGDFYMMNYANENRQLNTEGNSESVLLINIRGMVSLSCRERCSTRPELYIANWIIRSSLFIPFVTRMPPCLLRTTLHRNIFRIGWDIRILKSQ